MKQIYLIITMIVIILILGIVIVVVKITKPKEIKSISYLRYSYSTGNAMNSSVVYEVKCENECILKIKPKKIVYISCNPATLVRDLSKLEEKYNIEFIKPVDMFPFTVHVECLAVMELKNSLQ